MDEKIRMTIRVSIEEMEALKRIAKSHGYKSAQDMVCHIIRMEIVQEGLRK